MIGTRTLIVAMVPLAALAVGCTGLESTSIEAADPTSTVAVDRGTDGAGTDDASGNESEVDDGAAARISSGDYVIGCDRFTIGEDFGPLVAAYGVEDGDLGADPCFGGAVPTVEQAWTELSSVTPAALIDGVTLVAGYEPNGSDTLAYAGPIDDDNEGFLIAVDVETGQDDPGELRLTMVHELAHVFTQTTDQLDIAVFADECDTLFNGFGCFQTDAYITAWIDTFWDPGDLAALPSSGEADEPAGADRCEVDAAYPGSYAASHPEEDFAESLAAFVFDLDMPPGVQPRLDFFEQYDEFVEMRSRVAAAQLGDVANNFELCG